MILLKDGYYSNAVTIQRLLLLKGGYYSKTVTTQRCYYSKAVTIQRLCECLKCLIKGKVVCMIRS